nr:MAG TPA: hypothetical protein [Caudoviricetes sp.]
MQSSSFLCEFVCIVFTDYQCINLYKYVLHTKHNDFCVKFIYSVRAHKTNSIFISAPPLPY